MMYVVLGLLVAGLTVYVVLLNRKNVNLTRDVHFLKELTDDRNEYIDKLESYVMDVETATREMEDSEYEERLNLSDADVVSILRKRFSNSN